MCTESFHKESVIQQLKTQKTTKAQRQDMMKILLDEYENSKTEYRDFDSDNVEELLSKLTLSEKLEFEEYVKKTTILQAFVKTDFWWIDLKSIPTVVEPSVSVIKHHPNLPFSIIDLMYFCFNKLFLCVNV